MASIPESNVSSVVCKQIITDIYLIIALGRYVLGKTVGIRVAKVYTASEVAVSVPDLP